MSSTIFFAADAVAVALLVLGLYLPRHRRRDLALSYLVVNVGVLAVAAVLSASSVAAGLGLGLFGVLSIIRLRSEELTQAEIAYYFAALALGLLGGLGASMGSVLPLAFMATILVVLTVADSDRLASTGTRQLVQLDRALPDPAARVDMLRTLLRAEVSDVEVIRLDLVNDSTLVRVRVGRPVVADEAPGAVLDRLAASSRGTDLTRAGAR